MKEKETTQNGRIPFSVNVLIPGRVAPKGRPRFVKNTGAVYTPKATVQSEREIRSIVAGGKPGAISASYKRIPSDGGKGQGPEAPMVMAGAFFERDVPVRIRITFYYARPKSPKRKHMTTKPDIDNVIKTVVDAIQRPSEKLPKRFLMMPWIIEDDAQVVKIEAEKQYAQNDYVLINVAREGEEANGR